jgi:protein-disulfide isomerase
MEKYKADLNSQAVSDELAAVSELANKIQINGVPALVVNGKMVQTLDGSVIQDALNK